MTKKIYFFILISLCSFVLKAQNYNMTTSTISTCSGNFYDSGGAAGNYGLSQNSTMTFCSSTPGQQIYFVFNSFNLTSGFDYLYVYDGNSTAAPLLGSYTGTISPGTITSTTSGCLTFVFTSANFFSSLGWAAQIGCGIPPAAPPTATCGTAQPFCTGTTVNFPAGTNNGNAFPAGYGCLGSSPNPAWYYLEIQNPGNMTITMQSNPLVDIDFILWGPFPNIATMCASYSLSNVVDCSYSTAAIENADIVGATVGQVYLLLITNYSNATCNISFTQSAGTATTNCNILCNMTGLSANPTLCDPVTNTYSVSGQVTFLYPPSSGTLTISNSCGGTPITVPSNISLASPYSYTINNITPTGGPCTVTASFSADVTCNRTQTYTSPSPCNCGLTATPSITDVSCIGANDGTVTLATANALGALTYSWVGVTSSASAVIGLAPGSYSCYIIDNGTSNCSTVVNVTVGTIPDNTAPTFVNCPSNINMNNMTGLCGSPVSWILPTATDNCSATVAQIAGLANGATFPLGTSTVTYAAQDLAGNTTNCNFTVNISDAESPVFTFCPNNITVNNDPNSCSAVVSWTTPTASDNCSATVSQSVGIVSGGTFPLGTSNVSYTATDPAGNTSTCNFTVTVIDNTPPSIQNCPTNIVYQLTSRCDTIINWVAPTASDNCPTVSLTSNYPSGATFPIGTTSVVYTATDAVGLTNTCTFTVTIIAPTPLNPSITQQTNANCFGEIGNATGIVSGGSGSYNYTWNTSPAQTSTTAQMKAGWYVLTISDALASTCVNQDTLQVHILEPALLTVSLTKTEPSCFGFSNGNISANVTGGTSGYNYIWNTTPVQISPTALGLSKGNYKVKVTDAHGCVANQSVQLSEPDSLRATTSQSEVKCFGDATGKASLIVGAGTSPYTYAWTGSSSVLSTANNLLAGTYNVIVTDAQGCIINRNFIITQPAAPISANLTHTDNICYGQNKGTADISVMGGTPSYTYTWNTSPVKYGPSIQQLYKGKYKVTVRDAKGCTYITDVQISQPTQLDLKTTEVVNPYCDSLNGAITVNASGGTSPYLYEWQTSPSVMNAKIVGVGEGTYANLVTDANGCQDSVRVSIKNTPPAQAFFASYPSNAEALTLNQANLIFENQSQGGVYYSWTFGDGFNSYAPNPIHQFNEAGTYTATLWAFNSYNACPTSYSLTYIILPNGSLYIPTAFSPNNDGINDVFEVRGEGIKSFECEIFNRWGILIHKMNSQNDVWDGKEMNSGKDVPEGAYTYKLRALLNDGNRMERGGTITIIR